MVPSTIVTWPIPSPNLFRCHPLSQQALPLASLWIRIVLPPALFSFPAFCYPKNLLFSILYIFYLLLCLLFVTSQLKCKLCESRGFYLFCSLTYSVYLEYVYSFLSENVLSMWMDEWMRGWIDEWMSNTT